MFIMYDYNIKQAIKDLESNIQLSAKYTTDSLQLLCLQMLEDIEICPTNKYTTFGKSPTSMQTNKYPIFKNFMQQKFFLLQD